MDNEPEMKFYVDDKPFYKKIPVIGVIILVLLIGAWVFRWDYKMTDTYSSGKIVHKVDRWTGYHWTETYGNDCSGTETAYDKDGQRVWFDEKQIDEIWHKRNRATVIWYIAFAGTLGFIVYRIVRD